MSNELDPKHSPGSLKTAGVRRVNNLPVYLIGVVAVIFLGVMAMEASDRAAKQREPTKPSAEAPAKGAGAFANELVGNVPDGIIPAEVQPVPVMDADGPPIPVLRPSASELATAGGPPSTLSRPRLDPPVRSPELDQLRQQKLRRLDEAANAGTTIPVELMRSTSDDITGLPAEPPASPRAAAARLAAVRQQLTTAGQSDAEAVYAARLAELQSEIGAIDAPQVGTPRNELAKFDATGSEDRWALGSTVTAPRSRYEVRAGFVVPAIMISGINSDLPGQLVAQVSQDVFDTATGTYLLIPQGARLVGSYESDVAFGQARIFVVWQRIVFPDGKAMDIGAMPAADAAGYAGLQDRVNNHYWRLFGSAFLLQASR